MAREQRPLVAIPVELTAERIATAAGDTADSRCRMCATAIRLSSRGIGGHRG